MASESHPQGQALAKGTMRTKIPTPTSSGSAPRNPFVSSSKASKSSTRNDMQGTTPAYIPRSALGPPMSQHPAYRGPSSSSSQSRGDGEDIATAGPSASRLPPRTDSRANTNPPPPQMSLHTVPTGKPIAITTTPGLAHTASVKGVVCRPLGDPLVPQPTNLTGLNPAASAGQAAFAARERRERDDPTTPSATRPRLEVKTEGRGFKQGSMRPAAPADEERGREKGRMNAWRTAEEIWVPVPRVSVEEERRDKGKGKMPASTTAEAYPAPTPAASVNETRQDRGRAKMPATRMADDHSDFYTVPYEPQQQQTAHDSRARSDSRASRGSGSTTPLSAIADFCFKIADKVADKAAALAEKDVMMQRPKLGSRSGSAASVRSLLESFGKSEEAEHKKRQQELKAKIGRPKTGSFRSGADAFLEFEKKDKDERAAAAAKAQKPRIVVLDTGKGHNRDTSFEDFIAFDSKKHPAGGHKKSSSWSSRRESSDSDETFHCQGLNGESPVSARQGNAAVEQASGPLPNRCRICGQAASGPQGLCSSCQPVLDNLPPPPPVPTESWNRSVRASSYYPPMTPSAKTSYVPAAAHPTMNFAGLGNPYGSVFVELHGKIFEGDHEVSNETSDGNEADSDVRNTRFYDFYDDVLTSPQEPVPALPFNDRRKG